MYDELLFNGATFKDLKRDGPRILVSATDLADGTRLIFNPDNFDVLCTDLSSFRLARAAAASSAVPVVLSSITIDNYGGTCGYRPPPWATLFLDNPDPPRPAARTVKRLQELEAFADRERRPFLHLVDGGVSDNVGMRGVLDVLSTFEALHAAGQKTPYDHVRNIFIFVVNSLRDAAQRLGPPREPACAVRRADQGDWYANRSIFVRYGGDAAGHPGALGGLARSPRRDQALSGARR